MNSLKGRITDIEVKGSLSLVSLMVKDQVKLKAIVIETPESAAYLRIGNDVQILFKETEVVIGTDEEHSISLQNRISGSIQEIEKGALLSKLIIRTDIGDIISIISSNAVLQLGLRQHSKVRAMVKLNEMMLSE